MVKIRSSAIGKQINTLSPTHSLKHPWASSWTSLCLNFIIVKWEGKQYHPYRDVNAIKHEKFIRCFKFSKYSKKKKKKRRRRLGTSLVVQWLRLCSPNAGSLGSILGQGAGSHMPQLRTRMLEFRSHVLQWRLKLPHATAKTWYNQINS